jgi:CheY-like chemotaxis protein
MKEIRVLLVDDEQGYVDVLANRMRRRGILPGKAYSGTAAIQLLRRNDFDVAVLDLKMEDMDGIEVLKIFKKGSQDGGDHAHRARLGKGGPTGHGTRGV